MQTDELAHYQAHHGDTQAIPQLIINRRKSLDIPPYYERARHSTDIVVRHQLSVPPVPSAKNAAQAKKTAIEMDEHMMTVEQVCTKYQTTYQEGRPYGLSQNAAQEALTRFGPNKMPAPKKPSWIVKLALQFTQLFSLMLLLAAVLSLIVAIVVENQAEHYILAGGLVFSASLNAFITFWEEYKSEKILEGFQHLLATKATIYREGELMQVNVDAIVPGDIVQIKFVPSCQ